MMRLAYGAPLMMGNGFSLLCGLFMLVLLIDAILLGVWLWHKITNK
jgi:hypothetical protein